MPYILSVDDSRIIRRIMKGAIEALGYDILEAGDGCEGLEQLKTHPNEVDLILLDVNMPNLDGLETLKAIKANPATAGIPVMMVTSEGEREQLIQAIQSGATQYLTKPFTEDDLIAHIAECLPQDEY